VNSEINNDNPASDGLSDGVELGLDQETLSQRSGADCGYKTFTLIDTTTPAPADIYGIDEYNAFSALHPMETNGTAHFPTITITPPPQNSKYHARTGDLLIDSDTEQ
jgi:hypothetical protein